MDVQLSKEGRWFSYINGVDLKISRIGSTKYKRALVSAISQNKEWIDDESEKSKEIQRRIMAELYADFILKDWRGLKDEHGNEIKFSREIAIEILEDESYEHLYNFISVKGSELSNYYESKKEEALKN